MITLDLLANAVCFAADMIRGKPASWRSRDWRRIRRHHLKAEPACAWCGAVVNLDVHHIKPLHESPVTELDDGNLITLCRKCHFAHGHNGSWDKSNPNIRAEAAAHRKQ
jgi:5-methylcytosine-specific restriction endonuclease McrA